MKTFKTLAHFEKRLKNGICWGDWIKVNGREYKQVEYGDGQNDNYMLFQNKTTKNIIEVRYKVPCFNWIEGERIQTQSYELISIEEDESDELYRY